MVLGNARAQIDVLAQSSPCLRRIPIMEEDSIHQIALRFKDLVNSPLSHNTENANVIVPQFNSLISIDYVISLKDVYPI